MKYRDSDEIKTEKTGTARTYTDKTKQVIRKRNVSVYYAIAGQRKL